MHKSNTQIVLANCLDAAQKARFERGRKLLVSNVSSDTTRSELEGFFAKHGFVVEIVRKPEVAVWILTMETAAVAKRVAMETNAMTFKKNVIHVEHIEDISRIEHHLEMIKKRKAEKEEMKTNAERMKLGMRGSLQKEEQESMRVFPDIVITVTGLSLFEQKRRFPSALTLDQFKREMTSINSRAESMETQLFDKNNEMKSELRNGAKTLKEIGVRDGERIHFTPSTGGKRNDGIVKKEPVEEKVSEKIMVGKRCEVTVGAQMARRGEIAFVGPIQFKEGTWIGVKFDKPIGKNDGSVAGVRYFNCDPKYGGFFRPGDVNVGDFPELSIDEM